VLVLADADRLGFDLDQFGQRVLQAAAIDTAPQQRPARELLGANSEAEYTEAPASLTTTFCSFGLAAP
jgi:hypothetical protein